MLTQLFPHYPALVLVLTTAIVLMAGIAAQVTAHHLRVPSILLLLGLGAVLGPSVMGVVQPAIFGVGMRALVSISVAIIVFEGALLIDARQLRHCSRSVLGLITLGAPVTFGLAALAAHAIGGLPWKIAFLFGAIVSVTGPTVISPILKRLPLNHRLKTTLEAESVFVDALGVLLTSAVFSYITGSAEGVHGGLLQLGTNLAMGVGIGGLMTLLLKVALKQTGFLSPDLVRVAVLGVVLLGYSIAEALAHESGIAAVAVAGLLVGSLRLPEEETIKRFKGDLTLVALSLVFILLAASMPIEHLLGLGWRGVLTVLALMFVVRPLAVAASTLGTALTWPERLFIAWLGPRGIVATSMASLMAIELAAWGIEGGETLAALVFLTVILTVLIEGSGAGWIAARLKVMPKKVIVVGGDAIARKLGWQLTQEGESVLLLDTDSANVTAALAQGISALRGDATDPEVQRRLGLDWCHCVVAATPSDKANLLISQVLRGSVPDLRLIARVNERRNHEAFLGASVEPLMVEDAAAMTLSALVTRPTVLPLMGSTAYGDRLVEFQVGNPKVVGQTLRQLQLPSECLVALVKRKGTVSIPDGRTHLALGDVITLIGLKEAVDQARTYLESDS
ncbi:MAG TPA: cation:proton antiporter [Stenomitos sp.]